jgi:hypothetical protein
VPFLILMDDEPAVFRAVVKAGFPAPQPKDIPDVLWTQPFPDSMGNISSRALPVATGIHQGVVRELPKRQTSLAGKLCSFPAEKPRKSPVGIELPLGAEY